MVGRSYYLDPKVLPTGKNIHALEPQAIPTTTAMQSAKIVVDRLLERQKADNGGKYLEIVALVLWELITSRHMESLGQLHTHLDASTGWNQLVLKSLEGLELMLSSTAPGCSRISSSISTQMNLLDRAIKMVAELDEPEDQNFVRKHALEQAKTLWN